MPSRIPPDAEERPFETPAAPAPQDKLTRLEARAAWMQQGIAGIPPARYPRVLTLREDGMAGILDGKVALVTGGGGGIGRATALAMVREGAKVAAADFDAAAARDTVALINKAGG